MRVTAHEVWPDLPEEPVAAALEIAKTGAYDGAHHKQWVIDQMIRALTGCPVVSKTKKDWQGAEYTYTGFGESEAYLQWCRDFQGTEMDGDEPMYGAWETGVAP